MELDGAWFQRNPDFIFRRIADEMVLVPIRADTANMNDIFTLNEAGAFIWQQIEKPSTQAELLQALVGEYDAPTEQLNADLAGFLDELVSVGAILKV